MPDVAVILPLHRGARWLPATLESLAAQTFTDWHLIAVDDRCPEGSGDLVSSLLPQATVLRLPGNRGPAGARAAGVARADAPLLAFLDQDDLWHPAKLERQVAALHGRPGTGAVHTDALLIDEQGTVIGPADTNARRQLPWETVDRRALLRAQFEHNLVKMGSAVVRRDAWASVGGQRDPYGGEDWGLWVRLIARGWRIAHVAEPLHLWRQHSSNTSRDPRREAGRRRARRRLALRYAHLIGPSAAARYVRAGR